MAAKNSKPADTDNASTPTLELESVFLDSLADNPVSGYQGDLLKLFATNSIAKLLPKYEASARVWVENHAEEQATLIEAYNQLNLRLDETENQLKTTFENVTLPDGTDIDGMIRGAMLPILNERATTKQEIDSFLVNAHVAAFTDVVLAAMGKSLASSGGSSNNTIDWTQTHKIKRDKVTRVYARLEDGRLGIYGEDHTVVYVVPSETVAKLDIKSLSGLQNFHAHLYSDTNLPANYKHDPDKGQIPSRIAHMLTHGVWLVNTNGKNDTDIDGWSVSVADWIKKVKETAKK